MSIFSKIRNAKKAANEPKQSASAAQESKAEGKKPVYGHVPAQDAPTGSAHELPDTIQRLQEHQHRSKTMPVRTGSDTYLPQGSKILLRQKSTGDLSIQSVVGQKRVSQSATSFQMEDFDVPNPYGFHPHSRRGSGSARSRRNSSMSSKRGKSILSSAMSDMEIPEVPPESRAESSKSTMHWSFASSKFHESLPMQQYSSQESQPIQESHLKPSLKLQTSNSRPGSSSKGRVLFDFDQLDKYDDELRSVPTTLVFNNSFLTPDARSGGSQTGRLSPIPQSPAATEFSLCHLNRLTLNMKPDEDDWFAKFSSFESTPELEENVDPTVETKLLVDRLPEEPSEHIPEEPSTPAFALERDLSLLCNFDSGESAAPFKEIEDEFWKLSAQHQHDEPTKPAEMPVGNAVPVKADAPAYQQGQKEGLSRPPYPANNSWNPRWGPDVASEQGKDVLTFAQQLREQNRQSGRSLENTPTTIEAQRLASGSPTPKAQRRQENFKKHPRAEETWYQSRDSGMRLLEDDLTLESPFQGIPSQHPVSPPTAEPSSYVIDPPNFHHDRSRVPKSLSLRSPHATPSPDRQQQYNIFPSPSRESPNMQWNKPPPVYNHSASQGQKNHNSDTGWLSDDDEMWPIITHEPLDYTLQEPQAQIADEGQNSAPVANVSPLDEVSPVLSPVGQAPESYGHARNLSSSTGVSATSGRDRLRFPSRESSQRVRTTSHTSYDTWLSGRTGSPVAPEPLSPQYEHTFTSWGPTNSPMCIPEVTLPSVSEQYARFNNPTSIQNLYETVISPTSKVIPQRSMPNLKGSQPSTSPISPPPVPARAQSFTRVSSPPATRRASRSHSRGTSPTNFNPPRASISERPFLLQDPVPTPIPEKKVQTLRPETPLVTILDPYPESPEKVSNKLLKKKGSNLFNMWGKRKDGRGTATIAAY